MTSQIPSGWSWLSAIFQKGSTLVIILIWMSNKDDNHDAAAPHHPFHGWFWCLSIHSSAPKPSSIIQTSSLLAGTMAALILGLPWWIQALQHHTSSTEPKWKSLSQAVLAIKSFTPFHPVIPSLTELSTSVTANIWNRFAKKLHQNQKE